MYRHRSGGQVDQRGGAEVDVILDRQARLSVGNIKQNYANWIADRYASVGLASIYEVIGYVLRHRAAVDDYLATQERLSAEARTDAERRFLPHCIRSRLLARRRRGPGVAP